MTSTSSCRRPWATRAADRRSFPAALQPLVRVVTLPGAVATTAIVLEVVERRIATVEGIADIRASEEGREGVQSFLQKRKPGWLV